MTEKRFLYELHKGCFRDNGVQMSIKEVLDTLNGQHETITTLTSALKELKEIGDYQADRIKELTEENTKLEEQLRNLRRLTNELYMEGSE